MRYLLLIVVFIHSIASPTSAQRKPANNKDTCQTTKRLLNGYAYRKMMRNHFRYTILGTETPVSGFKVETDKPAVTLKGNIFSTRKDKNVFKSRALIVNLELTGELSDEIQEIFTGNRLSGSFRANLGFNLLFDAGNRSRFSIDSCRNPMEWNIRRGMKLSHQEEVAKMIDTAMVLLVTKSMYNTRDSQYSHLLDSVLYKAIHDPIFSLNNFSDPISSHTWKRPISRDSVSLRTYYDSLTRAIFIAYGADSTLRGDSLLWNVFSKLRTRDISFQHEKLLGDLIKAEKFKKTTHKYNYTDQKEIEIYEDAWTRKRITWLNFSLMSQNSSFTLYNPNTFNITDSNSFQPGFTVTYNYYNKNTKNNRYLYFRVGVGFSRVNSLPDFEQLPYVKIITLDSSARMTLTTSKSGNAYKGELQHGFGMEIPTEIFWNPWIKQAIPGFYSKLSYKYGKAWINPHKIAAEIGIIWNFKNDDEDAKNMLSIIPFVSWSNLLKEYSEPAKINPEKVSERFSIGIKLGIPINLGKRVEPGS